MPVHTAKERSKKKIKRGASGKIQKAQRGGRFERTPGAPRAQTFGRGRGQVGRGRPVQAPGGPTPGAIPGPGGPPVRPEFPSTFQGRPVRRPGGPADQPGGTRFLARQAATRAAAPPQPLPTPGLGRGQLGAGGGGGGLRGRRGRGLAAPIQQGGLTPGGGPVRPGGPAQGGIPSPGGPPATQQIRPTRTEFRKGGRVKAKKVAGKRSAVQSASKAPGKPNPKSRKGILLHKVTRKGRR